ncbi:MAG: hypothetical protein PHU40_11565 [Sulfurimonas sp.]|nr:hypothetical protein [Sulfurimonas sp.]
MSKKVYLCILKEGEAAMILGKCPYCDDGNIEVKEKEVRGKKVKLYVCTNAEWVTEDGEMFELSPDATCDFRIWQNSLAKYGKWLSYKEVRTLLEEEVLAVQLLSKKYGKKIYYEKNIILSQEYGVSVLWE